MASSLPSDPEGAYVPKRRPHPRLDSAKRSWYFFRRNTLAMVGLVILLCIGGVAVYAASQPLSWYQMTIYCGANYTGNGTAPFNASDLSACNIAACTYNETPPPNAGAFCGGVWYKVPNTGGNDYAGAIAPTWGIHPLSTGPLPLGSMTIIGSGLTTNSFYNIYKGLLRGSDWSLMFALGIVGIGAFSGLMIGAIAGYYGGVVDDVLMRLVDIFLSIPVLLFVVVVVVVVTLRVTHPIPGLGASNTHLLVVMLGFAATWWPFYARVTRGQVLVVREQRYVEAARASGATKRRVLIHHIIPNSMFPVFIQFSLDVGTIPILLGGLAFLGFGPVLFPFATFPEWGNLTQIGVTPTIMKDVFNSCTIAGCVIPWWQMFFPGLALFLFAISVNLLSDGLRDAFDPRLRR
jgi:peptide/nickel transport system permease protein